MFKPLQKFADELFKVVEKFSLLTLFFGGILIVILSVGSSFFIPTKALAIAASNAGAILGTLIACSSLIRLAQIQNTTVAKQLAEAEKKQEELIAKSEKIQQLEREVERLSAMKINLTSHKSVLKLGLLEVDATINDFQRRKLFEEAPGAFTRGEIHEYVGVLRASFRALLGVDLQKLRFRIENDEIVVTGLQSEFQGFRNLKDDWDLKEVRKFLSQGVLPDEVKILSRDERLADCVIEQRQSLQDRINKGIDFKSLDSGIKKMAAEIIFLLLSPAQKRIVFDDGADPKGTDLLDFISLHNREVDALIHDIRSRSKQTIELPIIEVLPRAIGD